MSATTAATVATGPGAEDGPAPTGWRRHRSTLAIGVALLAALALVVLTQGPVARDADLDPDNAGPDGARALAQVLADQGVEVSVVRTAAALDDASLDVDSLVVVTSASDLGATSTRRLLDATTAAGAGVVVVEPTAALLDELGIDGGRTRLDDPEDVRGDCTDPTYDDLVLSVDRAATVPLDGCFGDVLAARGDIGGDGVTLLGAGELLSNDQVLRADNAAVGLRLLGGRERLVWYVASPDDQVADDGVDIVTLLPDQVLPGVGILALATVLLVLWRGRRLGPLATEPLPVVVKAIEATRSRGRLYRRSGDRAHAAAALRAAARDRAATRLRLGTVADEAAVVRGVARHVSRPEAQVAALLASSGAVPDSDRALVDLAHDLTALEEEVRRS